MCEEESYYMAVAVGLWFFYVKVSELENVIDCVHCNHALLDVIVVEVLEGPQMNSSVRRNPITCV